MLHDDSKQRVLMDLFAELRRLKQEEMPWKCEDPIMQAGHAVMLRWKIEKIEEQIEREMEDG